MIGVNVSILVPLLGGMVGLIGGVVTLIKTFGTNNNDANRIQQALDQQIDEKIAAQLKAAWTRIEELEKQIADLQDSETKTKRENTQIKVAVKRFFRDLVDWNRNGRKGAMPLPSQNDLDLLELDPNEPSISRAELDELTRHPDAV